MSDIPEGYALVRIATVREFREAVRDLWAIRKDGPPYAERNVLKDSDALRAYQRMDAAGKAMIAELPVLSATAASAGSDAQRGSGE